MDKYKCYETLDKAEEMLYKELTKLTSADSFTPQSFKDFTEVVDALKDVTTICAMKQSEDSTDSEGYSERYPYYFDGMPEMSYANMYPADSSRRRGRDSMGRYTSQDSYSRHSDEKHQIMDRLTMMMRNAQSDAERMTIQKMIAEINR